MRKALIALLFGWVGLFYAAPILVGVVGSFMTSRTFGGIDWTPTLSNYAFSGGTLLTFGRTALLAAVTGAVCAGASFVIAGDALLAPARWKTRAILGIAVFSLITNSLMKVYAWALLLPEWSPWSATLVGMIHSYLPLALLLVHEGVASIDPGLIRAARDLGAGEGRVWSRVLLPLSGRFVAGAGLITAVFVFADFLVPQILGRGTLTLTGNRMSDLFAQQSDWPGMLAIGTVVLLLLFGAMGMFTLRRRAA